MLARRPYDASLRRRFGIPRRLDGHVRKIGLYRNPRTPPPHRTIARRIAKQGVTPSRPDSCRRFAARSDWTSDPLPRKRSLLSIIAEIQAVITKSARPRGRFRSRVGAIHAGNATALGRGMSMRIAAFVLAAGGATRMGRTKQLMDFEGKSLYVLRERCPASASCRCGPVVVVIGACAAEMRFFPADGIESSGCGSRRESGVGNGNGHVDPAGRDKSASLQNYHGAVMPFVLTVCDQVLVGRRPFA